MRLLKIMSAVILLLTLSCETLPPGEEFSGNYIELFSRESQFILTLNSKENRELTETMAGPLASGVGAGLLEDTEAIYASVSDRGADLILKGDYNTFVLKTGMTFSTQWTKNSKGYWENKLGEQLVLIGSGLIIFSSYDVLWLVNRYYSTGEIYEEVILTTQEESDFFFLIPNPEEDFLYKISEGFIKISPDRFYMALNREQQNYVADAYLLMAKEKQARAMARFVGSAFKMSKNEDLIAARETIDIEYESRLVFIRNWILSVEKVMNILKSGILLQEE